jgi:methylenetetrahydrofolate dehydrogenase (NADP+)/methenyltetrahydrofolate cyclohydrolase
MQPVYGSLVRQSVVERCLPYRKYFAGKQIRIVRFLPPENTQEQVVLARHEAARFSSDAKQKSFESVGCTVLHLVRPYNLDRLSFENLLSEAFEDPHGVGLIIQRPSAVFPQKARGVFPPHLDLDGFLPERSLFQTGATSEAIARLVKEFAEPEHVVAVVGSRGLVGTGVLQLLQQNGIECFGLDLGDDLRRTREAQIVVSATGAPGLLDERHITDRHVLVVDAGFTPVGEKILGDVAPSAATLPQHLTPVPGGVGPLQMAVLLERLVQVQGFAIEPWSYRSIQAQEQQTQRSEQPSRQKDGLER